MIDCDWDYDGYAGSGEHGFAKWNKVRYKTFESFRDDAPVEAHARLLQVDGLFQNGLRPPAATRTICAVERNDSRLAAGTPAIDAGQPLANINDRFAGEAPDLGAYELGAALPHYGPR